MNRTERNSTHAHRLGGVIKWGVIGAAVISLGAWGAWSIARTDGAGHVVVSGEQIFEVRPMSFDITIPASGELQALNSIEIRNRLESRATIKWIIDEGVQAKAGDVLVELNSEDIKNRLEEESLQVEQARAALIAAQEAVELQKHSNVSEQKKAELKVEVARLELEQWREGDVELKRNELKVALEKAERNVNRFKEDFANSEKLYAEGFISKSEKDEDEINLIEAEAELERAMLNFDSYEKYTYPKEEKQKVSALEEAVAELERVLRQNASDLASKQADLENKQRQLTIRESRLRQMQEQLEQCTIRAPSDGLVVYGTSVEDSWRNDGPLQIGQEVYPNQLLIVLPDTSTMIASVKVHETQSTQIERDQHADVRVDAMKRLALGGRVQSVSVMAQEGRWWSDVREYEVKILIDGENTYDLKPSMRCKANIRIGQVEDALAVPVQALFLKDGQHYVWVAEGGKYARRQVKIGRVSETLTEIVEGLEAGDRVLLREPEPGEMA